MFTDYILNGKTSGETADRFAGEYRAEPGLMRPFINNSGKLCVTVKTNKMQKNKEGEIVPVYRSMLVNEARDRGIDVPMDITNATSLRVDEWKQYDQAVLKAARPRLRAWSDLASANSVSGFDGMSKTILEYESASDPGTAIVDMDATTEGRNDSTQYSLEGLPLAITHSDFFLKKRQLMVSRNSGTPLDTSNAESAGRRVAEQIEKSVIGNVTAFQYGASTEYSQTSKVYGYGTHPSRNTKTDMTTPTGSNGGTTVTEILGMIETLKTAGYYGPYMIYHSTDWGQYMDSDYSTAKGDGTLRDRINKISQVSDCRELDYLTSTFTIFIIQMTADVARAINGMPITTVRWESKGGLLIHYKVMAIQVPQVRADYYGNSGIIQGTTA